jgi:hypothetical protein
VSFLFASINRVFQRFEKNMIVSPRARSDFFLGAEIKMVAGSPGGINFLREEAF